MCRKHELTQFELEVSSQDLVCKKQQREELATGVTSRKLLRAVGTLTEPSWLPLLCSAADGEDVLPERRDHQAVRPGGP